MNKYMHLLVFFIILSHHAILHTTLTSADLSCGAPVEINTSTTIIVNADISITDMCALIVAGPDFGTTAIDTVTFTSTTGNKVVVANGGTWNPSTFNTSMKQIQFLDGVVLAVNDGGVLILSGPLEILGAQLALYQGAIVWLNNGTITNQGTIQTIATGQ
jgi:hypothetical protein